MYAKEIKYSRETHDYIMYLDGKPIGANKLTYHDAENALNELVFELLSEQQFPSGGDCLYHGPYSGAKCPKC